MKKFLLFVAIISILLLAGCTTPRVQRIETDEIEDLSGYWNAKDVGIIADTLVEKCVAAPAITNYIANNGKLPVVIVGSFKNQSDEHIDTSIVALKFESALINSGKVDFVASAEQRGELRNERLEQQEWASIETTSRLANETGADFMLIGTVKTIVDALDNESIRTYYVTAELIDIESNKKLWVDTNSDINKLITKSKTRF